MSNLAKSKPEQLSQEVQKLRDLCYRDTVDIQKDKDLTENNILLSCNKCLAQILTDLEIEYEEENNEASSNILEKIHKKLQAFEGNVLGTQHVARDHDN